MAGLASDSEKTIEDRPALSARDFSADVQLE
jgi:hypothetical protein